MGDLIYLEEYKEKVINEEIAELRKELQEIMSTWPDDQCTGYFLSLEDMDKIEKLWQNEKRKL